MKGEFLAVAIIARLLLHYKDGPSFQLVVLGYQAALDSHEAVRGGTRGTPWWRPPLTRPPSPPEPMGLGRPQALRPRSVVLRTAFSTIVNYNTANHYPDRAANFARTSRDFVHRCGQLS